MDDSSLDRQRTADRLDPQPGRPEAEGHVLDQAGGSLLAPGGGAFESQAPDSVAPPRGTVGDGGLDRAPNPGRAPGTQGTDSRRAMDDGETAEARVRALRERADRTGTVATSVDRDPGDLSSRPLDPPPGARR